VNYWQDKTVRLRAFEPSDTEHFVRWDLNSERARLVDYVWPPASRAVIAAWVEAQSNRRGGDAFDDAFHWIIENQQGEAVGYIGTQACIPRTGTFSYGIQIASEHQRQGYASAAIRLVLKYFFEELRYQKATIWAHSYNEGSIRLHERLGFTKEGVHRRMAYTGGRHYDVIWFGMTVEEFQGALMIQKKERKREEKGPGSINSSDV
jgi:RimJ/RimL family protein N-acetyltransferase